MKATVIKPNGGVLEIEKAKQEAELEWMQKTVGGYIEIIGLNKDQVLIVNEEGKLDGLDYNKTATSIFHRNLGLSADYIVGTAILLNRKYLK